MVSRSTELRHLPPNVMEMVALRLNFQDAWKNIVLKIQDPSKRSRALYTQEHMHRIQSRRSPSLALLDDWGSHGEKRPNVQDLIDVLLESELLAIANDIVTNVLNEEPIKGLTTQLSLYDSPFESSSADSFEGSPLFSYEVNRKARAYSSHSSGGDDGVYDRPLTVDSEQIVFSRIQEDSLIPFPRDSISIPHSSYTELRQMTNNFDERDISEGGRKLGSGSFGIVYLGIDNNSKKVAVKRFKEKSRRDLFLNEIEVTLRFSHENLLRLLSYSVDGSHWCIIYEYMANGSLQDMLARKQNNAIPWKKRISIATGIARGIALLHFHNYIHRDIKSANVLLSEDLVPKLGDFGIIRNGPDLTERSKTSTLHIMGAEIYMAPEAFHGTVSVKLDTYSYGVVLLELLTGMKPYITEKKETLTSFISSQYEKGNQIIYFLDPEAGSWNHDIAKTVADLAMMCTKINPEQRPTVAKIVNEFESLSRQVHKNDEV